MAAHRRLRVLRHAENNRRCRGDHPSGLCLGRPTWEQTQAWRANGGLDVPGDRLVFDAAQPNGVVHLASGGGLVAIGAILFYTQVCTMPTMLVVCNDPQRGAQTGAQTTPNSASPAVVSCRTEVAGFSVLGLHQHVGLRLGFHNAEEENRMEDHHGITVSCFLADVVLLFFLSNPLPNKPPLCRCTSSQLQ